ncbi:MAG: ligand-binding sensor domain-containing protein/signal transduction histidine kinase [Phenylobacterium sp.]|jgi:ligand-binding sensor domain-containing protein/signal transduction histidine kinase/CheY-like chemotaxis protein/class 3 adenylate cyclase
MLRHQTNFIITNQNLMRCFALLLFAFFLIISSIFPAQAVGPVTRFDHLTIENGLSQNTVSSILQDSQGFLWFATQDGLNRYDGYSFKVFRHDPQDSGSLSANWVETLYEDSKGTMWIGTLGGGLNQYDPSTERFLRFEHDKSNPQSISHNNVWSIVEDKQGNLWVGTLGGGLNKLNPASGHFEHYRHSDIDSNSLRNDYVRDMHVDEKGILWLGTQHGLSRYNSKQKTFSHFFHDSQDPHSLSDGNVNSVFEDSKGILWIGTSKGLNSFDASLKRFTRFEHSQTDAHSISGNHIRGITEDSEGLLWIGTSGDGVNRFDRQTKRFVRFKHKTSDPHSLSNNIVRSLYEDAHGALWIGTYGGGLNKVNRSRYNFGHFNHQSWDSNSLSHSNIFAFHRDSAGRFWIGTNEGVNQYVVTTNDNKQLTSERFIHYKPQQASRFILNHNRVRAIDEDSTGAIWTGAWGGGLSKFDEDRQTFDYFDPPSTSNESLSMFINTIYIDEQDIIWIGLVNGLAKYNIGSKSLVYYRHDETNPDSLSQNTVYVIYEDSKGALWVGTDGGLNKFDRQTERFESYTKQDSSHGRLSDNAIRSIYEDSTGLLWVGTKGGLNKFDSTRKTFTSYTKKDGLPNANIHAILEDNHGMLWLSTNKGLSRFDVKTQAFKNYDVHDGLQSNEFGKGAYYKGVDGELFFGGINGFNRFFPDNIKDDTQMASVVLTDFLLANLSVPVKDHKSSLVNKVTTFTLAKAINASEQLLLTHKQNLISFEFAALHFVNPMKNQYIYQLEGQDLDWIFTDAGHRRATYTNLAGGEYTLRIKARNKDGYWSALSKELKITVLPPPWKTWWAYSLYCLAVASLILLFARSQHKKLQTQRQHTEDARAHNLQLSQVDKLKDAFLANTSHELRTPLNGIIGLAESLIDGVAGQLPAKANDNLAMVVNSGKRLANLINDILDFSKLKSSDITLNRRAIDLRMAVEVTQSMTAILVKNKALQFINDVPEDLPPADADEDRLQQILFNLIGNAIKFTDAGSIRITGQSTEHAITICIIDTGIGIEAEKLATIFDSFVQADSSMTREYGGSGLGLTVTRQLVELHGGSIEVISTLNKGTRVSITLPISGSLPEPGKPMITQLDNRRVDKSHSIILPKQAPVVYPQYDADAHDKAEPNSANDADSGLTNKEPYRILAVDDEPINQQVLANHLSGLNYKVSMALSGAQALELITGPSPFDLILLDVMMPRMSGYEVARKIREDYSASELPILMLTAKNQVADLVEGFSSGTNDYLAKPFSKDELLVRIKTQLNLMKINTAYARFLPAEFLNILNRESIVDVRLGDQVQKEMTVFNLNIHGFSALSEQLTPKQNFDFLNEYLGYVIPQISQNGGFIDKYQGDAVMALFPDSADDAVTAAVAVLAKVQQYNSQRVAQGDEALSVGIGLHSGSLMLGTIGNDQRMDGTVISDAVNLTARIEGLTKTYGVSLMVSELCFDKLSPNHPFSHRRLGHAKVKGKKSSLAMIEIFDGDKDEIIALKNQCLTLFETALGHYYQRDFESAARSFKQVLKCNPGDKTATLYHKRSAQLMVSGVKHGWDGAEDIRR